MIRPLTLTASLAALAVMPVVASAHSSTPFCPVSPGAPYTASNDPGYGVPVVTVNADGTLRMTWPDGYSRNVAAPSGCVVAPPVEPPAVIPPAPAPVPAAPPAVVAVPPVVSIAPPIIEQGGSKTPTRTQASSARWRVISTRCRVYSRRPANGVPAGRVPGLRQVRVRRDETGAWAGFADRHRVISMNGKARVVFIPGAFCGRVIPEVAG